MKGLLEFIVTPKGDRYNNKKDVDGKELIVNTEITERDAQFVNRVAEVIATPSAVDTPVEVGDLIIVHHNVFRTWYDQTGDLADSNNFLGENQFTVPVSEVFAYKKGDKWVSVPGYVFVAPTFSRRNSEKLLEAPLTEDPLKGLVHISNNDSVAVEGDVVGFTPESEYYFDVEGEGYYRIRERDLTLIY